MRRKWQKMIGPILAICLAGILVFLPQTTSAATLTSASSSMMPAPRLGGVDQYETAAKIAEQGWQGTSDAVVLAAGMTPNLVDALAAGPLSARLKAPILLTDGGDQLNMWAKQELERLKPTEAFITSGTAVIKPSILDELKAMGITPIALGGYDQYETSVNIAEELINQGGQVSCVVIAAGWATPADALSVSSIAASQGMPILATTRDTIPVKVKDFLDSQTDIPDTYVIGGEAVVGSAVLAQLPGVTHRYAGMTKYDTNIEVLKGFMDVIDNGTTYLASGETFVDALAGVPLAAQSYSAILLTDQALPENSCEYAKLNLSPNVVALGGQAVVPLKAMESLKYTQFVSADGAVLGSVDVGSPQVIEEGIRVTGNQVTLQNLKVNDSISSQGNVVTLKQVIIEGTLFLDPGLSGIVNLDNVTAKNIVVLSGAESSINLNSVHADTLKMESPSHVMVQTSGSTMITHTVVRSASTLEVTSGSVGTVVISNVTDGSSGVVELRGSFDQPIVVNESVTIRADGSEISELQISPYHMENKITLDGVFELVKVNKKAVLYLADNTILAKVVTYAMAFLMVPPTAEIVELDTQNTATVTSGGGMVNGLPTSTLEIPPSGGGGGGVPSVSTINVLRIEVITNPLNDSLVGSGNNVDVDMSGLPGETRVIGFKITTDKSCDLQFDDYDVSISLTGNNATLVKFEDLLPGMIGGNGVSLKTLRNFFGGDPEEPVKITVKGKLKQNGTVMGSISVTLNM
ncbi:MAG: cell wall-binding repeat-containing protein [Desulfosporosinus sp.]